MIVTVNPNPPVRYNTKREIEARLTEIEQEKNFLLSLNTSCGTCDAFNGRHCARAGGQEPPPEIKKAGCPEYFWDGIPF